MTSTPNGWTLPAYEYRESRDVNQHLLDQYGLNVTILRYTPQYDFMENLSPDWQPDSICRWVGPDDLLKLSFAYSEQKETLEVWFAQESESNVRTLWSQTGWYDQAVAWIKEHVEVDCAVRQYHLRPIAYVLEAGSYFFKAVAGINQSEPVVTAYLAKQFPHLIPEVIAVNRDKSWLLQRHGGQSLRSLTENKHDLERWKPLLRSFARLQIVASEQVDMLLDVGIEDRRLQLIPRRYDMILDDVRLLHEPHPEGIPKEEFAAMKARRSEVYDLCNTLSDFQIPQSICHDDFHANNIMVDVDRFGIIDWGECYVGHPFGSVYMLLRHAAYLCDLSDEAEELIELRDVYLEEWTEFAPLPRLIEAYHLAARVQKLNRALTWYAYMPVVEEALRPEFEGATEYWLRIFMGFDPDNYFMAC